jgi:hypothetical protein
VGLQTASGRTMVALSISFEKRPTRPPSTSVTATGSSPHHHHGPAPTVIPASTVTGCLLAAKTRVTRTNNQNIRFV